MFIFFVKCHHAQLLFMPLKKADMSFLKQFLIGKNSVCQTRKTSSSNESTAHEREGGGCFVGARMIKMRSYSP